MTQDSVNVIGKIKSVAVKDFVTYDVAIFYPDENLNIIIGPNGTGKSTIVAAIVLGMGGNCKLLSRSGSLDDYIKNGKEEAKIEIQIYKNANRKTISFNRIFNKAKKEFFEVDGERVSVRDYMHVIKKFNIQIDNLCQFLPQDRVQDFAKMNPRELLINTQISVCSAEVIETMEMLLEKRAQQKKLVKSNTDDVSKLVEEQKRNEELRIEIEKMRERNSYVKEIEIGTAKKAWIEYEDLYKDFSSAKDDLRMASTNLKEKQANLEPLKAKSAQITKTKTDLGNRVRSGQADVQKHSNELNTLETKTENLEDSVNTYRQELQDALSMANDRDSELTEAKAVMAALVQDCKNAHNQTGSEEEQRRQKDQIMGRVNKLKKENEILMARRNELNQTIENDLKPEMVNVERRIKMLENVNEMKLRSLQQQYEETYHATLWLRSNKHLFQGNIYEPMILELNVPDAANAKFLENTIGERDLKAFTCERKDDMALFIKKVRQEQRLKDVNIVQSDAASDVYFRPNIPIQDLRKLGFHSYLLDMVEGPPPILNYLCKLYNIHNVPVGINETQKYSSSVPDAIRLFFTPNHRFAVNKSKYSGTKSSRCDEIREKNLLNKNVDAEQLNERKKKLARLVKDCDKTRNHRNEIENEIKSIQDKCNDANIEKRRIEEKFNQFVQVKHKLKRQQARIEELTNRKIDVEQEKTKFKERVKKIVDELLQHQQKKSSVIEMYTKASMKYEINKNKFSLFLQQNADVESEIRSAEDALQSAQTTYNRVESKVDAMKSKLKAKQTEAKSLSNNTTPTQPNFPFKAEFDKLPSDIEALLAYIDEIQARVDCMARNNENIVEEYEAREKAIHEMKKSIGNAKKNHEHLEKEMKELHEKWFPEINRVVDIINDNFSNFMGTMGFAGEVEIARNAERDYAEYGIQVRVKYRNNEKLQTLDRYVQSGGERAVAIAVYSLSLQHISHVPFRCVDEINQGMDPRNERKIFEMLVAETCRPGQSQYFFITPKLLPNLMHNDLMSVFIVHNGKFIENPHLFVFQQVMADKAERSQKHVRRH